MYFFFSVFDFALRIRHGWMSRAGRLVVVHEEMMVICMVYLQLKPQPTDTTVMCILHHCLYQHRLLSHQRPHLHVSECPGHLLHMLQRLLHQVLPLCHLLQQLPSSSTCHTCSKCGSTWHTCSIYVTCSDNCWHLGQVKGKATTTTKQ